MDIFKQYYAYIQDNLCAYIQDNSFLATFICIYSRHNYIQDTIYMCIFKTQFICIYSRYTLYAYIQFLRTFICMHSRHNLYVYIQDTIYMHIFKNILNAYVQDTFYTSSQIFCNYIF